MLEPKTCNTKPDLAYCLNGTIAVACCHEGEQCEPAARHSPFTSHAYANSVKVATTFNTFFFFCNV